jgi:GTP-binding protein Era
VGKSTLLNHLLGQKIAIVSPRPQTTRHAQLGILTQPGYQMIFVDTPGMHESRNALGKYMVNTATRALENADAVLFIVNAAEAPDLGDQRLGRLIAEKAGGKPVVLALNKSDVLKPEHVVSHSDAYRALAPNAPWMLISATRGDNVDQLLEMLIKALPDGPQLYPEDEITQTHLRDLAGEFIREAALNALEHEVPHGIAVEVEEFRESPLPIYIAATIYVERETHKGIVIGKGGKMLKQIGSHARAEIEKLLEHPIYLDLRVKVQAEWRKDEPVVRRLGYQERE